MTIYKLDRLYTFHISIKERKAINEMKKNGINVSKFLRKELRNFGQKLALKEWEENND